MKIFEGKNVYLAFMLLLAVFISLPGCGKGTFGGGHWDESFILAVSSTVPANGDTLVPIGNKLSVTFNKEMAPATLNTTTFTLRHGTTAVSGSVAYAGVTAVFDPSADLLSGTEYTATVTTGAKDLSGAALAQNYSWSFTTGGVKDITPPTVTDTVNHNGATNVPINTKPGVIFSESMDPLTINSSSFTLKHGATAVPGKVSYSGVTAVFEPLSPLAYNTTYTGTITTAATDLGGNVLSGNQAPFPAASNYVWSWSTGNAPDLSPPTVTSTIPADGATSVATGINLTATFSEAMDPLTVHTGTFLLKQGTTPITGTVDYSGVTAVFNPASALAYNTTYTATITTGAKDLAGNPLAQNHDWSFTTGNAPIVDNTRPTVTDTTIVDGAIAVPLDTLIGATFSEAMRPSSLTVLTFTVSDGLTNILGTVSYSNRNVVFTPDPLSPLLPDTIYTATITSGARDLAGNELAGNQPPPLPAASNYVWSWRTAAAVPPPASLLDLMSYGVASAGGITNTGATKINGNVVLDPNMTCNLVPILFADGPGFGDCGGNILNIPTVNAGDSVITQIYPDTTTADAVMAQLVVKWNSISPALLPGATVLGCGTIGSTGDAGAGIGCSGNSTLPPGTYISATGSTIGVAGDLTLNGGPTDEWYFQAPTALTTAVNSKIILTGGAKASNVWWFVGSSASILGGSEFNGNVLASASITMGTGSTSCGRLLAGAEGAGNFTFLGNTVSVPGHPSAPPACQ